MAFARIVQEAMEARPPRIVRHIEQTAPIASSTGSKRDDPCAGSKRIRAIWFKSWKTAAASGNCFAKTLQVRWVKCNLMNSSS